MGGNALDHLAIEAGPQRIYINQSIQINTEGYALIMSDKISVVVDNERWIRIP